MLNCWEDEHYKHTFTNISGTVTNKDPVWVEGKTAKRLSNSHNHRLPRLSIRD